MTTVYFVRHAQPDYSNHDDALRPLTPKGQADTALVTAYLEDKDIAAVFSSPYQRAVDTVRPFALQSGLQVQLVDDFRERRVDSCWIEDFDAFSRQQWEDFDYKLSDGECLREVQQRNVAALQGLLDAWAGKSIAIGSHGTALSTVIQQYRPSYGYADFCQMKSLMPWIVAFRFDDGQCVGIDMVDVFQQNLG